MSLISAPIQAIISVLKVLGIWEQEKVIAAQQKIIREGREEEAKVLRAFADELADDEVTRDVPESSYGKASPGGPGLSD